MQEPHVSIHRFNAILAFFGAPIGHEDDPERAVRAGLEILEAIEPYKAQVKQDWGIEVDVRVGINTGLVVVGAVGTSLLKHKLMAKVLFKVGEADRCILDDIGIERSADRITARSRVCSLTQLDVRCQSAQARISTDQAAIFTSFCYEGMRLARSCKAPP